MGYFSFITIVVITFFITYTNQKRVLHKKSKKEYQVIESNLCKQYFGTEYLHQSYENGVFTEIYCGMNSCPLQTPAFCKTSRIINIQFSGSYESTFFPILLDQFKAKSGSGMEFPNTIYISDKYENGTDNDVRNVHWKNRIDCGNEDMEDVYLLELDSYKLDACEITDTQVRKYFCDGNGELNRGGYDFSEGNCDGTSTGSSIVDWNCVQDWVLNSGYRPLCGKTKLNSFRNLNGLNIQRDSLIYYYSYSFVDIEGNCEKAVITDGVSWERFSCDEKCLNCESIQKVDFVYSTISSPIISTTSSKVSVKVEEGDVAIVTYVDGSNRDVIRKIKVIKKIHDLTKVDNCFPKYAGPQRFKCINGILNIDEFEHYDLDCSGDSFSTREFSSNSEVIYCGPYTIPSSLSGGGNAALVIGIVVGVGVPIVLIITVALVIIITVVFVVVKKKKTGEKGETLL